MLAKEGCGRAARVVGITNASHPTVTEGTQMYLVTGVPALLGRRAPAAAERPGADRSGSP
jgi:hypothetical protein